MMLVRAYGVPTAFVYSFPTALFEDEPYSPMDGLI